MLFASINCQPARRIETLHHQIKTNYKPNEWQLATVKSNEINCTKYLYAPNFRNFGNLLFPVF